jgi:flavin-binding protein dodecin
MSHASNFESMVVTHIQNRARSSPIITERAIDEAISQIASTISSLYPTTEDERAQVRNRLLARFLVTMEIGVSVATQHQPWLADAR